MVCLVRLRPRRRTPGPTRRRRLLYIVMSLTTRPFLLPKVDNIIAKIGTTTPRPTGLPRLMDLEPRAPSRSRSSTAAKMRSSLMIWAYQGIMIVERDHPLVDRSRRDIGLQRPPGRSRLVSHSCSRGASCGPEVRRKWSLLCWRER